MARHGPHIQLKLSWDKKGNEGKKKKKKSSIPAGSRERERRRGKEESQASFQDLWSSVGRFLLGQEQKFIASTRGNCGYLKRGISLKIQEGRFREIEVVGFRRLPTRVSRIKVRDSSYLGLLSIFGLGKEGFSVKGLFGKEKLDFRVLYNVSLPGRRGSA